MTASTRGMTSVMSRIAQSHVPACTHGPAPETTSPLDSAQPFTLVVLPPNTYATPEQKKVLQFEQPFASHHVLHACVACTTSYVPVGVQSVQVRPSTPV